MIILTSFLDITEMLRDVGDFLWCLLSCFSFSETFTFTFRRSSWMFSYLYTCLGLSTYQTQQGSDDKIYRVSEIFQIDLLFCCSSLKPGVFLKNLEVGQDFHQFSNRK